MPEELIEAPEPIATWTNGEPVREPDEVSAGVRQYLGSDSLVEISPKRELPPIVDSAEFIARDIPSPPLLVDGLLHQGTKMVVGGGSKAFKTWLLLDLAICVAYGFKWLGFQCVQGRSLYANLEIQEKFFQERLMVLTAARGVKTTSNRLDIWNLRGHAASYHEIIPLMIERLKDGGHALDILDPIYKLYGKTDENSAGEVAQLLNTLDTMCVGTGAATAFGAHYSKGNQAGKESIDRISGSGVFARDPDSIISFTKHEEEGCFVVEPVLRNLPPVEPFVVRWRYPLMERDDDLDPAKLKQPNSKLGRKPEHDPVDLLSAIAAHTKDNPISIKAWAELAGVKRQTLSDYLPEMRSQGWIATIGEGSSARQYVTERGLGIL